jgi:hypothetical protein
MNNTDMDFEIWKQLKQKWTDLDAKGHKLKVDFQLIAHPSEENNVLAIDVIQHIDGKPVTETVQRSVGEAYAVLGLAGLSVDDLKEVYKGMMRQLCSESEHDDVAASVTMTPTSATSGELQGFRGSPDTLLQQPVVVNYQHYYVLSALRDKMVEASRECWKSVKAVYHAGDLQLQFEYS